MCGYANPLSFKSFNETDIEYVENFVQNELKGLLLKKCERSGCELKNDDMELMFGMYANSENEFKLMRGDRLLLQEIAKHLDRKFSTEGMDVFVKHFEAPKKYKVSRTDTDVFDFGVFYSKKQRRAKAIPNKEDLRATCFEKVKSFFESYPKLKLFRPITAEIVREIVETGSGFRADIVCVFCAGNDCGIDSLLKKYSIAYTKRSWNLSNFKKHIIHQHCKGTSVSTSTPKNNTLPVNKNAALTFDVPMNKNKSTPTSGAKLHRDEDTCFSNIFNDSSIVDTRRKLNISVQSPTHDSNGNLNEEKIMAMSIVFGDTSGNQDDLNSTANDKSLDCIFYDQFSAQNLKLIEAGLRNMEVKKKMKMMIENQSYDINITEVKSDGNCMFRAIVHQLLFVKCNTTQHDSLTVELRRKVVRHIEANLEDFKRVIQLRIGCGKDAIDDQLVKFLNDLRQNGNWGGMETLYAVKDIYRVNIVVFNEQGPFYYIYGFKNEFKRTIFLAYKIGSVKNGEKIYNHYDSIHSIDEDLLYKCANDLSTKMSR